MRASRKYSLVALGGTFTLIHRGHKELLSSAFKVSQKVIIGVSSDYLANRVLRKRHEVPPLEDRMRALCEYLASEDLLSRSIIVPLVDYYGPPLVEEVDALVVSEEGAKRAVELNELRKNVGLKPIEIVVVKMVLAKDGKPISCTRILRGEIDREGRVLRSSQ